MNRTQLPTLRRPSRFGERETDLVYFSIRFALGQAQGAVMRGVPGWFPLGALVHSVHRFWVLAGAVISGRILEICEYGTTVSISRRV